MRGRGGGGGGWEGGTPFNTQELPCRQPNKEGGGGG